MGFEARVMLVTKMHGACNDFVLIDGRTQEVADFSSVAAWICDRRAGVGADGLIVLERPQSGDVGLRIVNADGSEAEMCGNGVRCAARWLDEAGEGDRVSFDTGAGLVRSTVVAREPEYLVRVAMRRPKIAALPRTAAAATFVDLGNPHVVIFETNIDRCDLESLAAGFQTGPSFPGGTNVHVVAKAGDHAIRARHWERGVGFTQACGTGAVACAAVALDRKLVEGPVDVFVPGGHLVVEWDGEGEAYLTGPAARVFDTEVSFGASVVQR